MNSILFFSVEMMTQELPDTFFRKFCVVLCAVACFSGFWWGGPGKNLYQAEAADLEEQLWSFRFENLSVAEVLKQLSEKTGIDITTNQSPQEKRVTKSYENETVEEIIRDIFRGASYTLVWNYSDTGISSVGVYFFDQGGSRVDSRPTSRARSPAPTRSRVSRPRLPGARPSAARSPKGKSPPKKTDPNADDEDEDDEGDEGDEDEEEEDEEEE
jgi:hypothetical protein